MDRESNKFSKLPMRLYVMFEVRQFLLFVLSSTIGTLLFYMLYTLLYMTLPFQTLKPTVCWMLGYLFSIWWQHALHRWLVFRFAVPYWKSLLKTYLVYLVSFFLSSCLNVIMVDYMHMEHRAAWLLGLIFTGILSYFSIKAWGITPEEERKDEEFEKL